MTKRYHTLLVKEPNGKWWPQFGDYDRSDVEIEMCDERESGRWPKGTRFKVIRTGDKQADIDAAVLRHNEGERQDA